MDTTTSISVSISDILSLAPNIHARYRQAFENGQPVLDRYGISHSRLRVAHFMAQVLHECGGLTILLENLKYSAKRLPEVWPQRFQPTGPLNPADYAHNPQKLANEVYGNRMGNTGANDGFTYRGRGLLQLTGKESYQKVTTHLRRTDPMGPDFVATPDEVISADWCLAVAASEWFTRRCNELADADDVVRVTRAINGGTNGLADRRDWTKRTKALWR